MDLLVLEVVAAIEGRDWDTLKRLLHPYLHWTGPDGQKARGRVKVLRQLGARPPSGPPARCELRDGQVYRWVEEPG
jgi:hypothetical protein